VSSQIVLRADAWRSNSTGCCAAHTPLASRCACASPLPPHDHHPTHPGLP
jgi:hypothetical protein